MSIVVRTIVALAAVVMLIAMIGPFQALEGEIAISDKLAHALAFIVISAAMLIHIPRAPKCVILFFALLLGVSIEFVQGVTGRDADPIDVLADMAGAVVCQLFWWKRRFF